jgi:diguanylate cyclase (GGDEF)-like protein/PAS domain S-box-containing protein
MIDGMDTLTVIAVVEVLAGVVLMFLATAQAMTFGRMLDARRRGTWKLVVSLMGFFLAGYLAYLVILLTGMKVAGEVLIGSIFLGGAFFVLTVMSMIRVSYLDLQSHTKSLQSVNEELEAEIATRTRREQEIRSSAAYIRLLLASTVEGIYGVDLAGLATFCNPSCLRILGMGDEGEFLGRNVHELIHHSHADGSAYPEADCKAYAAFKTREGLHVAGEVFWRRDGVPVPVEYNAYPIVEGERVIGAVVTFSDVSEKLRARRELYMKEAALASSIDAIAFCDMDGTITYVNRAFLDLWGYEKEADVLGISAAEFLGLDGDFESILVLLRRQGAWSGDLSAKRADGGPLDLHLSASVVRDAEGNPLCLMGSFLDISRRKKLESELQLYATTDTLTGIANRRAGLLFLEKEIQMARRRRLPLSICYVDMDHLKNINDRYGHTAGDEAIRTVAAFMRESLREADLIFRLGGDEFVLVFPDCGTGQAEAVWSRVRERLDAFNRSEAASYRLDLSHGIAELDAAGRESVEHLISLADAAMYEDKKRRARGARPGQ